jgi:nucleotide-binding universal stress UspA family protein
MDLPIDSVLLPTDGSDGALAGVRRGIDLADVVGADVHVLSVVDVAAADSLESILDVDGRQSPLERDAERAVDDAAALARDADLDVTTAVERGVPFETICEYVDDHDVDVVAMGTKGRTGLERIVLGSVTQNVLRTASSPVLAVPLEAGDEHGFEDVLLPTDGSEAADVAVEWGLALADAFDAMAHALYSADTSRLMGSEETDEVFEALERQGERALATVRERATDAGVSVTGTVASGPPSRAVLTYADEHGVDLIVMGTRGRSGVAQHFLGSVTENVVRNADVPVFCVPADGTGI